MTEDRVAFDHPSESTLRAQIEIHTAPARVYAAWTEPEILPKWFSPRSGGHLQIDRFEPTVDGDFDLTMVFSDGDRARMTGRYLELDPPRKIAFTWRWDVEGGFSPETRVTVDLVPSAQGTRLTLTHERFPSLADRERHQGGWGMLLDRLATQLAA